MLTSVVGSLRIELSAAFSMTGANTCPIRSSLVAWAIAVGKTRPITAAKRSGSSTMPVSRHNVSISRPTSKVRSCSSCRSRGVHTVTLRAQLGLQALRDFDEQTRERLPIDGVIARGRAKQPLKDIGVGAHLTR